MIESSFLKSQKVEETLKDSQGNDVEIIDLLSDYKSYLVAHEILLEESNLDDFDNSELIGAINAYTLDNEERHQLSEILGESIIEVDTMVGEQKRDFFIENFDKITLEQLESLVK